MMMQRLSDKELASMHVLFMRLFDKAHRGNLGVDAVGLELIEKILAECINEMASREAGKENLAD